MFPKSWVLRKVPSVVIDFCSSQGKYNSLTCKYSVANRHVSYSTQKKCNAEKITQNELNEPKLKNFKERLVNVKCFKV